MKELRDFLKEFEYFTYEEVENRYEEVLDECYEPVELAGMTIYASEMKNIDPVMFRCAVADFSSEEYQEYDGKYYLNEDFSDAENSYEEYLNELEEEEEEA